MRPRNKFAVTVLIFVIFTLLAATCARFADDSTKARLYGWLPGGAAPVDQGSTNRH